MAQLDFQATSFQLVDDLLKVRYENGDKAALKEKCLKWLATDYNVQVRTMFAGSRMLCSQLDLLDMAKHRVNGVLHNVR